MTTLLLYDHERSGNCHKARLLLSLLGLEYARTNVDIRSGATREAKFLALNPRAQIPVLADGETVIWDSMAILAYLARRYGDAHWLPPEPLALARVMQWLALSENEILYGLARARSALVFGLPYDVAASQALGRGALQVMEGRLAGERWVAGAVVPSIADVACYPYVALAPEGGVSLEPYPAVRGWLGRVEDLPGYVGMPGVELQPRTEATGRTWESN